MNSILRRIKDAEPIIKNEADLKAKSFEDIVYDKFEPFIGLTSSEIEDKLKINLNPAIKSLS